MIRITGLLQVLNKTYRNALLYRASLRKKHQFPSLWHGDVNCSLLQGPHVDHHDFYWFSVRKLAILAAPTGRAGESQSGRHPGHR